MGRILTPGGQPQQMQIPMGVTIEPVGDQVAIAMTFGPDTRRLQIDSETAVGIMELLRRAIVTARSQQIDLGINGDGSGTGLGVLE